MIGCLTFGVLVACWLFLPWPIALLITIVVFALAPARK
jgi:hypothetical protein